MGRNIGVWCLLFFGGFCFSSCAMQVKEKQEVERQKVKVNGSTVGQVADVPRHRLRCETTYSPCQGNGVSSVASGGDSEWTPYSPGEFPHCR